MKLLLVISLLSTFLTLLYASDSVINIQEKIIISHSYIHVNKSIFCNDYNCMSNYAYNANSNKIIAEFFIHFDYNERLWFNEKYSYCTLNRTTFDNITRNFLETTYNIVKCSMYNIQKNIGQEQQQCNFTLQYNSNYFYSQPLYVNAIYLNQEACNIYKEMINAYTYQCFKTIDNNIRAKDKETLVCGLIMFIFISLLFATCARENYVYGGR